MKRAQPSRLPVLSKDLRASTHKTNSTDLIKEWEAAVELIHRSNHILLICHVSPDGDAIGSLLGLGLGLRTLGKKSTLACESPVPDKFSFLPDYDTIVDAVDKDSFDLIISLDCSDTVRLGNIYDADLAARRMNSSAERGEIARLPLINIDHHITNIYFGDVNLVDPKAASTAEIVLALLDRLSVSIDQDGGSIATCLLTGIVTDTVGFRTANVTPQVMKAAVRLMEMGASLAEVTYFAFNQRPVVELSLLARGLNRMQVQDGLAWSEITLADRHACGCHNNDSIGLAGTMVRTHEVHVAAVFSEKENSQVEVSFRADPGFDVAQLAFSLGGGGHPAASGCTVNGSLEAVKARVLPMLRAILRAQGQ